MMSKGKTKMSDIVNKFIELEKKKEIAKQIFKELKDATAALAEEIGVGGHFQDTEGTVYQVVVPQGTFVEYSQIGYERTRRADEKKGSLSLKKARELGYEVE